MYSQSDLWLLESKQPLFCYWKADHCSISNTGNRKGNSVLIVSTTGCSAMTCAISLLIVISLWIIQYIFIMHMVFQAILNKTCKNDGFPLYWKCNKKGRNPSASPPPPGADPWYMHNIEESNRSFQSDQRGWNSQIAEDLYRQKTLFFVHCSAVILVVWETYQIICFLAPLHQLQ